MRVGLTPSAAVGLGVEVTVMVTVGVVAAATGLDAVVRVAVGAATREPPVLAVLSWARVLPGGVALPAKSSPQQAMELSTFTAQVWPSPALTRVNEPVGMLVSWPRVPSPQQAIEPVVVMAQLCIPPR